MIRETETRPSVLSLTWFLAGKGFAVPHERASVSRARGDTWRPPLPGQIKATSMEVKGACGFGSSRNAFDTDVCKMTDRWPSIVKDTVPISAIVK